MVEIPGHCCSAQPRIWREMSLFISFHWFDAKMNFCIQFVWFSRKHGKKRQITNLKFGFFFVVAWLWRMKQILLWCSINLFFKIIFPCFFRNKYRDEVLSEFCWLCLKEIRNLVDINSMFLSLNLGIAFEVMYCMMKTLDWLCCNTTFTAIIFMVAFSIHAGICDHLQIPNWLVKCLWSFSIYYYCYKINKQIHKINLIYIIIWK